MRQANFIGPGYTLPSPNVDIQNCRNFILERHELGGGKNQEQFYLRSRPKLVKLVTLADSPTRGGFAAENGRAFCVAGATLYEITDPSNAVFRGTLTTASGRVAFAGNTLQLLIVDGANGYVLTYATNTFAQVADPDFLSSPTACQFLDQYILAINAQDGKFYFSALSDATDWNGLDFATAEGSPDKTTAIIVDHRQVFLFGDLTVEVWVNDGVTPFSRMAGAFIEHGIAAPYTACKIDNTVFWVGKDRNGQGIVWRLGNGFAIERVSTFALEYAISTYGDISTASAFAMQLGGHSVYCLNFPGAPSTWVYDIATGTWTEWDYTAVAGGCSRFRGDWHIYAGAKHVIGDYQNGNLYELVDPYVSVTAYTDDGAPITRERTAPHVADEQKYIFYPNVTLDLETGRGPAIIRNNDDGVPYEAEPTIVMMFSDDAHTWSNEKLASIGKTGDYKHRVRWNKLGRSRSRAFRIRFTDPIPLTLISGFGDISEGSN